MSTRSTLTIFPINLTITSWNYFKMDWGDMPPVEGSSQMTRSMLEMRNPKCFDLSKEKHLEEISINENDADKVSVPGCPYVEHSLELVHGIKNKEKLLDKYVDMNSATMTINKVSEFRNTMNDPAKKQNFNNTSSCALVVPMLMNDDAIEWGLSRILLCHGFEDASKSTLSVLRDVIKHYLSNMCTTLRSLIDNESLTGRTGFYDCLDQLLHDMNIGDIHALTDFYEKDVIQHHKQLKNKYDKVQSNMGAGSRLNTTHSNVKVEVISSYKASGSGRWRPITKANQPTRH
ncbi:unnamed protein product [Clavelina lepadiformis]|uniref:Bromodomain associated domain-containing protein n=1 Tax=Clavelina lepadiformis TaxID=159417 RepID=A0ABP0G523_CLALP